MTPLALIGLSGYATCGKNTAADELTRRFGWQQRSFAEPLKAMLYATNPPLSSGGTLREAVDAVGWDQAKRDPEVRGMLQRLGTEGGRRIIGPDVWVNATMRCLDPFAQTVITDTRFVNEADTIRARGGIVVRITRPGVGPARDEHGRVHDSEVSLDGYDFDHEVINDGPAEALGQLLHSISLLHATQVA